jgi:hypothetical protein
LRKFLLSDLEQVDPSLLTQEAVGHKNPEETSGKKYGLDASGAGGSRACSRQQAFCPGWKGDSSRNGHYCTVSQVVRVSPGRENRVKRNLGVRAPAAHCGNIRSSPQVRDYQVRERSRHRIPQQQTSASPSARRELRRVKELAEGRLRRTRLRRLGFMRPPPVRLGQVSKKGGVNRDSASQILSGSHGLATRGGTYKVWKSARWSGAGGAARK